MSNRSSKNHLRVTVSPVCDLEMLHYVKSLCFSTGYLRGHAFSGSSTGWKRSFDLSEFKSLLSGAGWILEDCWVVRDRVVAMNQRLEDLQGLFGIRVNVCLKSERAVEVCWFRVTKTGV